MKRSKTERIDTIAPKSAGLIIMQDAKSIAKIINQPRPIDCKPLSKKEADELIEKIISKANKSGVKRSDIEEINKPEWFSSSLLWSVTSVFEETLDKIQSKTSLNKSMDEIKKVDPWLGLIVRKTLWSAITSTTAEFGLTGEEKYMAYTWVVHGLALRNFEISKDWLNYQVSLNCPDDTPSDPAFMHNPADNFSEQWTKQALKNIGMSINDIKIDTKPESQSETLWTLLQEIIDNLKKCNEKKINPLSEEIHQDPKYRDLALLRKSLNCIFTETQEMRKRKSSTASGKTITTENPFARDRLQMELMLDNLASHENCKAFKQWRGWVETCPKSSKKSDSASSVIPLLKHNPTI